jgi:hypothetical protein
MRRPCRLSRTEVLNSASEPGCTLVPIDGSKTRCRADRLAADLPPTAWTRRSAGDGSKGPRFYDWSWLADVGDDGRHSVLIRRNTTTGELAFYR